MNRHFVEGFRELEIHLSKDQKPYTQFVLPIILPILNCSLEFAGYAYKVSKDVADADFLEKVRKKLHLFKQT